MWYHRCRKRSNCIDRAKARWKDNRRANWTSLKIPCQWSIRTVLDDIRWTHLSFHQHMQPTPQLSNHNRRSCRYQWMCQPAYRINSICRAWRERRASHRKNVFSRSILFVVHRQPNRLLLPSNRPILDFHNYPNTMDKIPRKMMNEAQLHLWNNRLSLWPRRTMSVIWMIGEGRSMTTN